MGSLHKVLLALSDSNINVDTAIFLLNRETGTPIMVIYAEDIYEVEKLHGVQRVCVSEQYFPEIVTIHQKTLAISSGV